MRQLAVFARSCVRATASLASIASLVLLLATLAPLAATRAHAQPAGAIAGRVLIAGERPVAEARVLLVELDRITFTDAAGAFRFDDVPPGGYHLEAASHRFGSTVAEVDVGADTARVELRLDVSAHRETIVVTATRAGRGSAEVVQPVGVMDRNELSENLQPSLGETLAQQSGVSSSFFGAGSSRPIIRGQGGGRVRVLEGGLGVGDASTTSPDHAVATDVATAERIEILRGPATLLYGSSAVGGVVNVIDGRVPEEVPPKPFNGTLDLRLRDVDDERAGALTLRGGGGRLAWYADATARDTGDYDIPGRAVLGDPDSPAGTLPNSAVESSGATLGGSWVGESGFVGLAVRGFDTRYGIPAELEHEEEAAPVEGGGGGEEETGVTIDLEQRRLDLRGGFDVEFGPFDGIALAAGATDYEHRELEGSEVGTTFSVDSRELRVELTHGRGAKHRRGVMGLQASRQELEVVGAEAFLPPQEDTGVALFALEELERGRLRWELGGRLERVERRPEVAAAADPLCEAPRRREFDLLSGSLGLVWLAGERWAVGTSLTRSERAPAGEELFACGEHVATLSFEIGEPDLGEETNLGLDVSLRRRTGRITGELNLYAQRYDDYVFAFDAGATEPPGDPGGLPVFATTQADAEFHGAELRAVLELVHAGGHDLDLEFLGDVVRAELAGTGQPLPRIPPWSVGLGVTYEGRRWHGSAHVRRHADQSRNAPSETPTGGYTLVDTIVGYRIIAPSAVHDLMLRGTNLADEEARPHTSRLKQLVPLPGRAVSLIYRLVF